MNVDSSPVFGMGDVARERRGGGGPLLRLLVRWLVGEGQAEWWGSDGR